MAKVASRLLMAEVSSRMAKVASRLLMAEVSSKMAKVASRLLIAEVEGGYCGLGQLRDGGGGKLTMVDG